ncbi:unnamed protein product, partial [Mesorhabditis belari]|uniref:Uncharacterized protein n=1 Tax=Mesorhabditis belari TaxID=2138241 RepID=A0AAF3FN13_9BILA
MRWEFKPVQDEIYLVTQLTDLLLGFQVITSYHFRRLIISTRSNVFCFEEQILNPGEQVDLPVFFYIDPDYANDPNLEFLDSILLSYTFFEAKSGLKLPSPFEPKPEATNVK